jgi:hypothetical protein
MQKLSIKIIGTVFLIMGLISCSSGGGSSTPNTSITYTTLNYTGSLPTGGSTGLTGIRHVANSSESTVYITGSYSANGRNNGTLYVGNILGGGVYYVYNFPGSTGTNVYSADNEVGGNVGLTGSYVESSGGANMGFYYSGPVTDNNQNINAWTSLTVPSSIVPNGGTVKETIPHSIMGGLIVGNYLAEESGVSGLTANAFIYNVNTKTYTNLVHPTSKVTSAYGIWYNSGTSYTITGGYSNVNDTALSYGFLVDYDSATGNLSNWTGFKYNNNASLGTHFEGITTDGNNGYNLAGTGVTGGASFPAFVHVTRNAAGGFNPQAIWVVIGYPSAVTTTSDTVYQNYLLGVYTEANQIDLSGYVATIPTF